LQDARYSGLDKSRHANFSVRFFLVGDLSYIIVIAVLYPPHSCAHACGSLCTVRWACLPYTQTTEVGLTIKALFAIVWVVPKTALVINN
jgi:hypothetical protein